MKTKTILIVIGVIVGAFFLRGFVKGFTASKPQSDFADEADGGYWGLFGG
jgi:hypothetical protein